MRCFYFVLAVFLLTVSINPVAADPTSNTTSDSSGVLVLNSTSNDSISGFTPDYVIISINQTGGWIISGPMGSPPSEIDVPVNPGDVNWISIYFRDAEPSEHFEDDTGIVEEVGVIVNGQTMGKWSFYDPYFFFGGEGSHEVWKSYYDPKFKITFRYKPSDRCCPLFIFSKDVWIHYKNLQAGGDAGFEEVISLCIAGGEALSLDPVRANWESWKLEGMTSWEIAAYGTFLTAFKTLYMWEDASQLLAQNLNLTYWRDRPAIMVCGVTNLGFIGGEGYTYLHAPPITIGMGGYGYTVLDVVNSEPRDYDRRVKAFNIARGIILKELETIILNRIGVNATSSVQEIISALENGTATIEHDPSLIEYFVIGTPDGTYMSIDLAGNGETEISKYYPLIGWLHGALGTGGACYHYQLTQHTQKIIVKDWVSYLTGVVEVSVGTCALVAIFAEVGLSEGLLTPTVWLQISGACWLIKDGIERMQNAIVVEYT